MTNDIPKRIGHLIKKNRKRKNISQTELGEHLGVDHSTISRYESGKIDTTIGTLKNISNYCGFEPTEYVKAFYTDESVQKALRKIGGCDNTSRIDAKGARLEKKILSGMTDETRMMIVSAAEACDKTENNKVKEFICDAVSHIVIEIEDDQNPEFRERQLKSLMTYYKKLKDGKLSN